jgi:hypothetical protein
MTSVALRRLRRTTTASLLTLAAGLALASGNDGVGTAQTGDAAAYNLGKGVVSTKLVCRSCPLAGKTIDAAAARELLNKKPVELTAQESAAVDLYLKRRFKL